MHRPATTSLLQLVRFAHQRWAIEQQYRELKTNLGLDHFEGRTFPGWHHHVVLTAITYNFLQAERRRRLAGLTFPAARAIVQEIFTAYLFAQRPHYLRRIEALKAVQLLESDKVVPSAAPVCRGDLLVTECVHDSAPAGAAPAHPARPGRRGCGPALVADANQAPREVVCRISWRNRRAGLRWTPHCLALRGDPCPRLARAPARHRKVLRRWPNATPGRPRRPCKTSWTGRRRPRLLQLVRFAHHRWAIEQQYR